MIRPGTVNILKAKALNMKTNEKWIARTLVTGIRQGLCLCVLLSGCLIALPVQGLVIRGYDPARHNRFASGFPASPAVNPNFHAAFYDFSGVGWHSADPNLSCTLVSPSHFIGANHVKPGIGATVTFYARDGVLRSFTVANQYNMTNAAGENTDLFIGELNQPVMPCDNITFYPILKLASEGAYVGKDLHVYGKSGRVGKTTISAFQDFGGDPITGGAGINSTRAYSFSYSNALGSPDDCHAEGGDSGSPSFVGMDGELFVAGVHGAVLTTGLGVTTFDTFVPHYLDQISGILRQRGYQTPTSAREVFRLCYQLTPLAPDVYRLSWTGHRGRVYQVEATTNGFNFSPVSRLLTANVATVTYVDSNSTDRVKFHRVRRMDFP